MKALFILLSSMSCFANAEYKIAVVDMELAIQSTSDFKLLKTDLEKEFRLLEGNLKKREFGLQEKIKDFESKAMILSEKKREEQRQEIQKLAVDFQKDSQDIQFNWQKKQMTATQPILAKMEKHIAEVSKEMGCDLVINKSPSQVLWVKSEMDITHAVIAKYEKAKKS